MGVYTFHTDTDAQVLRPEVAARLERRLALLPAETQTFTVTRQVLTPRDAVEPFESARFVVQACNGATAGRAADAAKYALEVKRGHHQTKKGRHA